ncbi:unnamed protein product, partial [Urochloa humidicola]
PYPVISLPPPDDCEQIEHGLSSRPPAAVRALLWPNEAQASTARVWGEMRLQQLAGRACSDRACRRAAAGGPGPSASSGSRACGASYGQWGGAIRELWWPAQG